MSGSNGSGGPPVFEYAGCFTLKLFHEVPSSRYLIEIPELNDADFTGMSLSQCLANATQGLIFFLDGERRRLEQVRPARPARRR